MPSTCPCWSSAWAQVRRRTCSCHLQTWPGAVHGPARSNHRARFTVLRSADRYPFLPACLPCSGSRGARAQPAGGASVPWIQDGSVELQWRSQALGASGGALGCDCPVRRQLWFSGGCAGRGLVSPTVWGVGCLYVWCSRGSMVRLRGTGRPLVMAAPCLLAPLIPYRCRLASSRGSASASSPPTIASTQPWPSVPCTRRSPPTQVGRRQRRCCTCIAGFRPEHRPCCR